MKLSPEDNNGTEDSAQTDNNSHFNSSRPGSSGTNLRAATSRRVQFIGNSLNPQLTNNFVQINRKFRQPNINKFQF